MALLKSLPHQTLHPMSQLVIGLMALQKDSKFAKAYSSAFSFVCCGCRGWLWGASCMKAQEERQDRHKKDRPHPSPHPGGVHKKEYWKHTLEDILDVWAKLPEVAALVYANTYKGGKVGQWVGPLMG